MTFTIITFLAFGLAQLADVVTTVQGMKRGASEANPIIRKLMDKLGSGWIPAKLLLTGGAALLCWQSGVLWMVWLVTAITAAVSYRNTRQ